MIVHSEPSSTVVSALVGVISFEAQLVMDNATVNPIAIIILFFMVFLPVYVKFLIYHSYILQALFALVKKISLYPHILDFKSLLSKDC